MGDLDRLKSIGHLLAEIYRFVGYYNLKRIHSAHKLPLTVFRLTRTQPQSLEVVSDKMGS